MIKNLMEHSRREKLFFQLIIVIVLLIPFSACSEEEGEGSESSGTIKLMSYNILQDDADRPAGYLWSERKANVIKQIKSNAVDILCAQEDYYRQGQDIMADLNFGKSGVSRNDGTARGSGEFVAIYYKKERFQLIDSGHFWMSETPAVPSKSWDASVLRICNWAFFQDQQNQQKFYVFNTHLDHIGTVARYKSAQLLIRMITEIAGNYPVILAGDMNATPDSDAIKELKGLLSDSREISVTAPAGSIGTYNGMVTGKDATRRIDYVFLSGSVIVNSYRVISETINNRYPSDHFPVLVDLSMNE